MTFATELAAVGRVGQAIEGLAREQALGVLWFVIEAVHRDGVVDEHAVAQVEDSLAENRAVVAEVAREATKKESHNPKPLSPEAVQPAPVTVGNGGQLPRARAESIHDQIVENLERMGYGESVAREAATKVVDAYGESAGLRFLMKFALPNAQKLSPPVNRSRRKGPEQKLSLYPSQRPQPPDSAGVVHVVAMLEKKGPLTLQEYCVCAGLTSEGARHRVISAYMHGLLSHDEATSKFSIKSKETAP